MYEQKICKISVPGVGPRELAEAAAMKCLNGLCVGHLFNYVLKKCCGIDIYLPEPPEQPEQSAHGACEQTR